VLLPAYPIFGLYGGVGFSSFALWPVGYADSTGVAPPPAVDQPTGDLRLDIQPKDAEVFVDGYYAGIVDDFSRAGHRLNLPVGPHHLDIRALGYESIALEIIIQASHTTTYRAALVPLPPGSDR
jgi:hypothetical protein